MGIMSTVPLEIAHSLIDSLHIEDTQTRLRHTFYQGTLAGHRVVVTTSGIGKVRHKDQILPGVQEPLISEDLFQAVQLTLKRNSGRSETLHAHPEREYLLKGIIRCAYCGMPMWAQTEVLKFGFDK